MKMISILIALVASMNSLSANADENCLSKEEAKARWAGMALIATREVVEIGKKGGLGMGFYVEGDAIVVDPDTDGPAFFA